MLRRRESPGKLVVQIRPVRDQYNRRIPKSLAAHQQAGEKKHGVALTTARRAEVGAALTIAQRAAVVEDVRVEHRRRIILRIAADDLLLLFTTIREVDEIPNHIPQPPFVEKPFDQREERADPILLRRFLSRNLPPRIVKLVRSEQRAHPVVPAVADHAERVVFHQLWDVPSVAGGELHIGIVNRRVLADRALELEYHQRQTIDVENQIRDAGFVAGNFQLAHRFVDIRRPSVCHFIISQDACHLVLLCIAEGSQPRIVDELDKKILLRLVFPPQQQPVRDQLHEIPVTSIQVRGWQRLHPSDDSGDLILRDSIGLVASPQILSQIRLEYYLSRLSGDFLPPDMRIALLTE